MSKLKHYKTVQVAHNALTVKNSDGQNVEVRIYDFPGGKDLLGKFYIPMSTYLISWAAFDAAVRARAKHDLKITYDHYSWTSY